MSRPRLRQDALERSRGEFVEQRHGENGNDGGYEDGFHWRHNGWGACARLNLCARIESFPAPGGQSRRMHVADSFEQRQDFAASPMGALGVFPPGFSQVKKK